MTVHIIQHFLLALVTPALLLLCTPRWFAAAIVQRPNPRKLERVFGQPPLSWLIGVGTMLAWHIPVLFNAALANGALHIFQLLTLLVSGIIFWWPILTPLENRQLHVLGAVSYLFSACLFCSLLGAFLTFGPVGLYASYAHPSHFNSWGLDPKGDQQLAGMLMWVPGCFVYLSGILSTVRRWYGDAVQREN